ncbi:MAG: hypothetical protein ACK53L_29780 [Pirellulaceae bacterium]
MKVREVLGFLVGAWLLAGGQFVARAQELGSPSASKSTKSTIVSSLEKIQKDFVQHVEKEKQMQDKYRELESKLKKTEDELQRVNAQGMQQQLAAMQTAMQSMQLNANLRLLATGNAGGNSGNNGNNNNTMVRDFAQMQLMQNRFLQNLDATMRADEMRQLDANAQAIVRSRIETIQAAVQLQQSWGQWQNESISFYTRYWPVSDPEGRWSPGERDAALETLEKRHENDIAAKLATANVLANATRHAEALKLVEEIVELPTQLQGVAMMEKAKILTLLDKDKEAKQALQAALKLDKDNPHLRWIRAEVAREQGQDSIAESELRFLSTIKSMEIQARRSLALLYAKRSKKTPGDGGRAIKEAKSAMDLETIPDWYSHYVMAVAYAAGRKPESALESVGTAESMAEGEDKERCQKLKATLEGGKP